MLLTEAKIMASSTFVVALILATHFQESTSFLNNARPSAFHTYSKPLTAATEDISTDTVFGLESWKNGYKTCKKESVEALEAGVPTDLEGTYYRNGFGKFESGRVPILHPFDADGMVAAVTMKVAIISLRSIIFLIEIKLLSLQLNCDTSS